MIVLGIDPGINGALAYTTASNIIIHSVPTVKPALGNRDYDIARMFELLVEIQYAKDRINPEEVICYIEDVHSMPGDGIVGAFSFGRGVGIWHGLLVAAGIPMCRVPPATWKKALGLSKDKDASRFLAMELYPSTSEQLKYKKDHDKAEALLIAYYGEKMGKEGRC